MDRLFVRQVERQSEKQRGKDGKLRWRKGAADVAGPRAIQVIMA